MRKSKLVLALATLAVALFAIPAISQAGRHTAERDAKLAGKNEVPGPGSKKGHGDIQIFLKPTQHKVCFNLEVKNLDTVTDAHIHKGAEGVAGAVKVPLFTGQTLNGTGNYNGCVKKVRRKLIQAIKLHPGKYYANVHTQDFPGGAIRGQLERPPG